LLAQELLHLPIVAESLKNFWGLIKAKLNKGGSDTFVFLNFQDSQTPKVIFRMAKFQSCRSLSESG
jgi:hypothetical protein